MINKQEIDRLFTNQIPQLKIMINSVKIKKGKTYITTDAALSECYLHISKIDEIRDEKHLQSIIVNFLNKSLIWTNSKLNKLERVSSHNDKINYFDEFNNNDDYIPRTIKETISREDSCDTELQQKINIEKWYDEKKCILSMYRQQEEDKVKQIIYDCFFNKGLTKGVQLAKHLKINKDYACRYIRVLKQDIRDFYDQYKQ